MNEGLGRPGLEALYLRLERPLYNLAYRWLWDAEEAMDVVQEAFVRLWRARERIEPDTAKALAYAAVINLSRSRRRARRLWRWATLEPLRERGSGGREADAELQRHGEQARLRAAIEALPEKLKEVVLLCELSELQYDEVSEALGIPIGTVASRRHRALQLLRAALAGEGEDGRENAVR